MLFQEELDQVSINFSTKLDLEVAKLLNSLGLSIAVAETVTSGLLTQKLSMLQGSSNYFRGSIITNHNITKIGILGISPSLLKTKGPESKEVANETANRIKNLFKTDISIAVNGLIYHKPSSSDEESLSKINISFILNNDIKSKSFEFNGNSQLIREKTCLAALGILKQWLSVQSANVTEHVFA